MSHPAQIARDHIMAGLEACQADQTLSKSLESLAQSLAQAQGKLFPASKLPADSPAAIDMMRRGMEYLAQALKVLQEVEGGGDAVGKAAGSIAQALKTLHPVVQNAKDEAANRSIPPPEPKQGESGSDDTMNVNVNTMLNMNTDHQFFNGFSENIGEGGIFVATFDPKPVGAKVIVNFKLPGGRPVTARGNVQFVREYNPINPEMAPGMGVKFTDLLPKDKAAIEGYLETRAPMFYDDE
jgi:uncharacterized protein (TIGR02266 family)